MREGRIISRRFIASNIEKSILPPRPASGRRQSLPPSPLGVRSIGCGTEDLACLPE